MTLTIRRVIAATPGQPTQWAVWERIPDGCIVEWYCGPFFGALWRWVRRAAEMVLWE